MKKITILSLVWLLLSGCSYHQSDYETLTQENEQLRSELYNLKNPDADREFFCVDKNVDEAGCNKIWNEEAARGKANKASKTPLDFDSL